MNSSRNRYEIFLKVAELGSITLAAEALNYTQSGVSHAVAAMEREAGCALFRRSKTGVTLTVSGAALIPCVRQLVGRQHALDQAMDALSNRVSGRLRVGSFTSFTAIHMPRLIREFTSHFPDVTIELANAPYRDIEQQILQDRLDCGFLSGTQSDELEFHPLFEDEMFVIAPPGHGLEDSGAFGLEKLDRYDFISQFRGSDHDVQEIVRDAGIHPRTRYILDDDISVMGMVSQGMGLALMPEMMLNTARFDLVRIPLSPRRFRTIGIASAPASEVPLLVRTFVRFCREDGGKWRGAAAAPEPGAAGAS